MEAIEANVRTLEFTVAIITAVIAYIAFSVLVIAIVRQRISTKMEEFYDYVPLIVGSTITLVICVAISGTLFSIV